MTTTSPCPDPETLTRMLRDELTEDDSGAVEEHVGECPTCQGRLEEMTREPVPGLTTTAEGPPPKDVVMFLGRLLARPSAAGPVPIGADTTAVGPGSTGLSITAVGDLARPRPDAAPRPAIPGYEILDELGHGGMGVVFRARETRLNRLVALKMLHPGGDSSPEMVARFQAEAGTVARLQHPNVVRIHSVGRHAGRAYFEMEYVGGGSLADRLDGTPWPPRRAAEVVAALARGVEAVHRVGVIHRDLKPSNVLMATDGVPKLGDFGLAKDLVGDSGLTRTGTVLGSPSYMAPEQAEGGAGQSGTAADVYSLGAVLYEVLTGRPPFRGATVLETLAQVKAAEPVAPGRLVPGLSRDLETICLKCLEKLPQKRYDSAAALAADLDAWLEGRPIAARPSTAWGRSWKLARRRPWQAAMLGLAAASAVVVLGTWTWSYARIGDALEAARRDRIQAITAGAKSDRMAAEARRLATSEAAARAESTRRSAGLALDKGRMLAESGRVGRGLLWMARAVELAAGTDEPLQRAASADLVDWGRTASRPRSVVDLQNSIQSLDARNGSGRIALGNDGRINLVDPEDFRTRQVNIQLNSNVLALVSGDGRKVAGGDTARLMLLDFGSGDILANLDCRAAGVHPRALAIDRAGERVAFLDAIAQRLWVWTPAAGQEGLRKLAPDAAYRGVSFSPDGRRIAAIGADRVARVWDAATLAPIEELPTGPVPGPTAIAHLPDGSGLVLWGHDPRVEVGVWDFATHRHRFQRTLDAAVSDLSVAADSRSLLVGARDGSIRRLDASKGWDAGPVIHATSPVLAAYDGLSEETALSATVALSPDGRTILSAHDDATARTWDAATGRPVGSLLEHPGAIRGVGFVADGRTAVTATVRGQFAAWDLADGPTGRPLAPRLGLGLDRADVSRDGRTLVATGRSRPYAALIDVATGLPRSGPLLHDEAPIRVARISPDGRTIATGGDDGTIRLWNASGVPLGPPLPVPHWVMQIVFSPDGRTLGALDASYAIMTWDLETRRRIAGPERPAKSLFYRDFLLKPDGRDLVVRAQDHRLVHLDFPSLRASEKVQQMIPLNVNSSRITRAAGDPTLIGFAADPASIWVLELTPDSPDVARRHDLATWRRIGPPVGRDIVAAILDPGARRILARSGATVRLYDADTGAAIGMAMEHPAPVVSMAFTPGGETILTGAEDGGLRFWDAATGRPIGPPRLHTGPVASLAMVGDGGRVVTCVDVPRLWDVPGCPSAGPKRLDAEARVVSAMNLDDADNGVRQTSPETWRRLRDGLGSDGPIVAAVPEAARLDRDSAKLSIEKQAPAALRALDALLAIEPDDPAALLRRSRARLASGDPRGAAEDDARAERLAPGLARAARDWVEYDLLVSDMASDRLNEALRHLDQLVEAHPRDPSYRMLRSHLRFRTGRRVDADDDARILYDSGVRSSDLPRWRSLLALDRGDLAAYRAVCRDLVRRSGTTLSWASGNQLAWQLTIGDPGPDLAAVAVDLARRALAGAPPAERRLVLNTLGAALCRAGHHAEALAFLEESVQLAGGQGVAQDWAFLTLVHHRLGHADEARRWLRPLQEWRPSGSHSTESEDLEIENLRREAINTISGEITLPADPFAHDPR